MNSETHLEFSSTLKSPWYGREGDTFEIKVRGLARQCFEVDRASMLGDIHPSTGEKLSRSQAFVKNGILQHNDKLGESEIQAKCTIQAQ